MSEPNEKEVAKSTEEVTEEIFKRMVTNDKKQNQFLKVKLSKSYSKRYNVNESEDVGRTEKSTGMRFVVVTLGVLSLAMSQMSRGTINYCITSMVDPKLYHHNGSHSSAQPTSTSKPSVLSEITTTTTNGFKAQVRGEYEANTLDPILFYMTTEMSSDQPDQYTTGSVSDSDSTEGTPDEMITTITATTTNAPHLTDATTNMYTNIEVTTSDVTIVEVTTTNMTNAMTEVTEITKIDQLDAESGSGNNKEDKFMWSVKEQSLIKGGFFYSYFFFMILGGRMSEIYGAKYVLLLGVAGSALINLATPWMARNSITMLIVSRVIMGAIQSGVFPAMYALINKWLTMSEASIYAPMIKMSLRIGGMLAASLPGVISSWPNVFYIVGLLGAVWSTLWLLISTSEPSTNKWVTKTELNHILKKKRKPQEFSMTVISTNGSANVDVEAQSKQNESSKVEAPKTPWIKIITSPSVIGLIMAKFAFNSFNDFIQVEVPSYLRFVHEASKQRASAITTGMYLTQICLVVGAGWFAKVMIKKHPFGLSKTVIRKIFQALANLGTGLLLFMLTIEDCGLAYATVILELTSVFSIFTAGGETMLPYDLSEEYPATIMAIANSVANLSGTAVTTLTGFVLGDQAGSQSRWNTVISLIAGADIVGGLMFCFLVKAKPIDFSSSKEKAERQSERKVEEEEDKQEVAIEKAPSYENAMKQEAKI